MIRGTHMALARGSSIPSRLFVAFVLLLLAASHPLLSQQQDERAVRTAFIYNLTKYVDWPKTHSTLIICVFGPGTTGGDLKRVLNGKASGDRKLQVMLQSTEPEMQRCNIAYFPGLTRDQSHSLNTAVSRSVLSVGEDEAFVREGGMVAFVRSGDSIQIQVNIDAVQAAGLTISSRLLDLAIIVHTKRHG
ncbi:MAG TPA: YfiR family protein [Terracidiphilus sp.]|nr:YfiR family protein [Terracidiphilus sp.]